MSIKKSQRTGGPKTPEGKAVTSRNALKSGAYSQLVVLPGEESEDFAELQQHFFDDFKVQGVLEATLAGELAALTWRKMRLQRLERGHLITRLGREVTEEELRQVDFKFPYDAKRWVLNQEQFEGFNVKVYRRYLKRIDEMLENLPSLEALEALESNQPDLFDWLLEESESQGLRRPTIELLSVSRVTEDGNPDVPFINRPLKVIKRVIEAILWVADHQEELESARERIRDNRLLSFMQENRSARIFGDLDKNFYRTLTELRKQQDWRRKHGAIDVTPIEDKQKEELPAD